MAVVPYSLKDAPALIERLLPVQKLCVEAYKEQMAGSGKTLTALGSYWKGRKPLILARACVLGSLLPATRDPVKDLQIFEMLMGMDIASIEKRLGLDEKHIYSREELIEYAKTLLNAKEREKLLGKDGIPFSPYRLLVTKSRRPEEIDIFNDQIWDIINAQLGTSAESYIELVKELGIMRFGHPPRVVDTFCGSGQIPFEAARLGCDIYASDLNPVACMLTWGAFHIIGSNINERNILKEQQKALFLNIQSEVDRLHVEEDGNGWRAKVFLYCFEVRCPQSGWMVPLLPTLIVSENQSAIAELIPNKELKRYDIAIRSGVSDGEITAAMNGTVRTDGKGQDPYLFHTLDGVEYRTKISTLRGDYRKNDGTNSNRLRLWEKHNFKPQPNDLFQERLYCIQWMRPKDKGKGEIYEFRTVNTQDLTRESVIEEFIADHLDDWQAKGWIPDMRIEPGDETERLYRERGWTYWHHLFNPRQLFTLGLMRRFSTATTMPSVMQCVQHNAKLSRWNNTKGHEAVINVFDNQALNTLFNYGCRSTSYFKGFICVDYKLYPIAKTCGITIENDAADSISTLGDIFITDPPYGDAVKYEEILEFFIAWLRKNPPKEFAHWIWDSRRSLAIKGEGEDFRRGMVSAYKRMTECMQENGIQVIMFTHQGGPIWADMANIVWASGLQVTAAWYVVTETESALREGSYVKGTVLLVCRKRRGLHKTTRDDLAWEIQEEVESQVQDLTGLNQKAKSYYRNENVFEDADIQMAGYAAALRVLTRYATIDGRDMTSEAIRPRVKGEITFVDGLIAFAVDTANQCLVPQGIEKRHWDKCSGAERFYLKMIDMESRGAKKLDNYQNFAKAFKVRNFQALMASQKANEAQLKSAVEFGKLEMNESSELFQSVLRAVLYCLMELMKDVDSNEVLAHLTLNIPNYYGDMTQRELVIDLSEYLAKHFDVLHPEEASAARVLCEMVKNQRLG